MPIAPTWRSHWHQQRHHYSGKMDVKSKSNVISPLLSSSFSSCWVFHSSPSSLQCTPSPFMKHSFTVHLPFPPFLSLFTSGHFSFCFPLSSSSSVALMHSHRPFIHVDVLFIKASIIQPTPRHLRLLRSTSHSISTPQHMVCPWRPVHSQILCSSPPFYWTLGGLTHTHTWVIFFETWSHRESNYGSWWSYK